MSRTRPLADPPALVEISAAAGVAIVEVLPPTSAPPALIEILSDCEPTLDVVVPASAPAVLEVSGTLAVDVFLPDAPVSIEVLPLPGPVLTIVDITEYGGA